ncbi:hypothetical protein C3L33_06135, partial [Rhododendron williamsianum]
VLDVLRGTKQKRHRDGYEHGATVLRKVCSALDFVWSDSPLEILGSVTSITFKDPACLPITDHALTTEEVKALCDDLRVLGKQDFKHLLNMNTFANPELILHPFIDPNFVRQGIKKIASIPRAWLWEERETKLLEDYINFNKLAA